MMNTCVYLHINPVKHEIFYVGIGNSYRPYEKRRSIWWKRTVDKYGYIIVIIHENLTWSEACSLEIKYIKQIGRKDLKEGTLVNMTDGGDGAPGHSHTVSKQSKKKMSELKRNLYSGANNPFFNKHHTDEAKNEIGTKNKIAYNNKSEEFKEWNRISNTGKNHSMSKSILQFDLKGIFLKEYESINQAAKILNLRASNISMVLNRHRNSYAGFIWRFKNNSN